jgi:dTDP-4-dehydrorhamnose reductase
LLLARDVKPTVILLTGAEGQVGWELRQSLAPLGTIHALDRVALDLADLGAVRAVVRHFRPDVIVNAAAYTQVDRAESDQAAATRVNAEAPGVLAIEAARLGAVMVHYSTDYVFDGMATRPYVETDAPAPRNVYGASKLAGERAVRQNVDAAYVFRLSWVYGLRNRNFLRTILRLAGEQGEMHIVADQFGTPTWARFVAAATATALVKILAARRGVSPATHPGVYHVASPDHTSWHGFAAGILQSMDWNATRPRPRAIAIATSEFPTAAERPAWSVLSAQRLHQHFGIDLPPWRAQLAACLSSDAERP